MKLSRVSLLIAGILSIILGLISYRFLVLDMNLAFPDFGSHIRDRNLTLLAHISSASIALIIGAIQLLPKKRAKQPILHRWLGRFYGFAILIGGISGFMLAVNALGGMVAGLGFGLLAIIWVGVTIQAIRMAMVKNFVEHRKWMIRSFALTFAAVTLRLYLLGFVLADVSYIPASVYLAWMCWLPNIIFAEWWIRRTLGKG
ncbi:MAG: DUF2306 domain-containing protein [Thiotrichaceae bacterium]|nr:DUF2306 domain-containing protein [Thiotrichaceae bacterium]